MSDATETEKDVGTLGDSSSDYSGTQKAEIFERPTGLKGFYYHPVTQVCMLGFTCFMCPGLYNALSGLGAGGQVNATDADNANAALYSTFAFFAFFAGTINNVIGSRLTLILGTWGYTLYIGSLLAVNIHPGAGDFVVVAGAFLGICAALLWTAQGSLMLAYATEAQKGRFVAIFWSIFNLGAVIGAAVALGQNFHSTANNVGNGTYIAFIILTGIGIVIPFFMVDPRKIIRTDGTKVTPPRYPSWKTEFYSLWVALRTDPWIILLFPMFYASNYFTTWQFNDYNSALFTIRGRSLNDLVYWLAQIFGSIAIGSILDQPWLSRRTRAYTGWGILFCMMWAIHGWAYHYQKSYTRASVAAADFVRIDIYDSSYPAHIWLMIFYGLFDAMWQTTVYWLMGAMSNDPNKLACFVGFYKSIQSAAAAGVWRADGVGLPFMNIFASTWAVLAAGLLFALPMLVMRIKNHTDLEDEALVRMDEQGHIHSVEEVTKGATVPTA